MSDYVPGAYQGGMLEALRAENKRLIKALADLENTSSYKTNNSTEIGHKQLRESDVHN